MAKDEKGQIGNELLAAVVLGAFAFVAGKIGKYER